MRNDGWVIASGKTSACAPPPPPRLRSASRTRALARTSSECRNLAASAPTVRSLSAVCPPGDCPSAACAAARSMGRPTMHGNTALPPRRKESTAGDEVSFGSTAPCWESERGRYAFGGSAGPLPGCAHARALSHPTPRHRHGSTGVRAGIGFLCTVVGRCLWSCPCQAGRVASAGVSLLLVPCSETERAPLARAEARAPAAPRQVVAGEAALDKAGAIVAHHHSLAVVRPRGCHAGRLSLSLSLPLRPVRRALPRARRR